MSAGPTAGIESDRVVARSTVLVGFVILIASASLSPAQTGGDPAAALDAIIVAAGTASARANGRSRRAGIDPR